MILNALYELYGRLVEQGVEIPRMGMSSQKIGFRIIITRQGDFVRIEDARAVEVVVNKGKRGSTEKSRLVVPNQMVLGNTKPSGPGVNPCFLWDNAAYLLGCKKVKDRALEYFAGTRKKYLEVEKLVASPKFSAVCRFLEQWNPEKCETEFAIKELFSSNGVFRIQGDEFDVHEDAAITKWWLTYGCTHWSSGKRLDEQIGICLVTGQKASIARVHSAIKGNFGGDATEPKLVSFNHESFLSYGKNQSYNSPVSEEVAFAYSNALNYLLRHRENHLHIGDALTVFWTDSPQSSLGEDELFVMSALDNEKVPAMDEAVVERVRCRVEAIAKGQPVGEVLQSADAVRFCILGLAAASKARLTVRFFWESSLGDFARNIQSHFAAMAIQGRGDKFNDPLIITPKLILRETVRDMKDLKKLPPLYGGALMRAILAGLPYPDTVALSVLQRMRVDGNVNYVRCAYLKAWLTRKSSLYQITSMLDKNNTQPGYVLGRLFAALVKTQKKALPSSNRTIKEAFYSSASATPQCVFPHLFALYRHHLTKLEVGLRVDREKLVQEIMSHLAKIPARLNMEQQALFALGYYHQMQDFYKP